MAKQSYNVMRRFRIDEISGVDSPAQKGARVVLRKRDAAEPEAVRKYMRLLSDVEGHSHVIDDTCQGGESSWDVAEGEDFGHSHPYVMNNDGSITIGMADGHTHSIIEKRAAATKADFSASDRKDLASSGAALPDGSFPIRNKSDLANAIHDFGRANDKAAVARHIASRAKAIGATDMLPTDGKMADTIAGKSATNKGITMTQEQIDALNAQVKKLEGDLAVANALVGMNDAEKSHYGKLDAEGKIAFLKSTPEIRKSELAKAAEGNPVVYKSDEGVEFRKSDDPRMVDMAKRLDSETKLRKAEQVKTERVALEKRAGESLTNLPGSVDVKVAVLKAVDSISDEATRTAASALLKAGNDALKAAFGATGTSAAPKEGAAGDQLTSLAKARATEKNIDFYKAYDQVAHENPQLLEQAVLKT